MNQKEFNKALDKVVKEMAKKHGLTKHRLLNYGGMIGAEFQERIKGLKKLNDFETLFNEYLNGRM